MDPSKSHTCDIISHCLVRFVFFVLSLPGLPVSTSMVPMNVILYLCDLCIHSPSLPQKNNPFLWMGCTKCQNGRCCHSPDDLMDVSNIELISPLSQKLSNVECFNPWPAARAIGHGDLGSVNI
jgi:hypothetical protein